MHDLFDALTRQTILARLSRLEPASAREWGKMDAAQMCARCAIALEMATGDHPRRRNLIGRLLGPFKPRSKGSTRDAVAVVGRPAG